MSKIDGMVVKLAKRYARPTVPMEDLISEGQLAVLEWKDQHDPEKGALETFLWFKIRDAIATYCRDNINVVKSYTSREGRRDWASGNVRARNVTTETLETIAGDSDPFRDAALAELSAPIRAFFESLTDPRERMVWESWMADDPATLKEMGERVGVTKQRIGQISERLRIKARAALAEAMGGEG